MVLGAIYCRNDAHKAMQTWLMASLLLMQSSGKCLKACRVIGVLKSHGQLDTYEARISVKLQRYILGTWPTISLAATAYDKAALCINVGLLTHFSLFEWQQTMSNDHFQSIKTYRQCSSMGRVSLTFNEIPCRRAFSKKVFSRDCLKTLSRAQSCCLGHVLARGRQLAKQMLEDFAQNFATGSPFRVWIPGMSKRAAARPLHFCRTDLSEFFQHDTMKCPMLAGAEEMGRGACKFTERHVPLSPSLFCTNQMTALSSFLGMCWESTHLPESFQHDAMKCPMLDGMEVMGRGACKFTGETCATEAKSFLHRSNDSLVKLSGHVLGKHSPARIVSA